MGRSSGFRHDWRTLLWALGLLAASRTVSAEDPPPPPSPPPTRAAPEESQPTPVEAEEAGPGHAAAKRWAWLVPQLRALGDCDFRDVLASGNHYFVACGGGGLWVVERVTQQQLRLLERLELPGKVVGVFWRNGQLWVEHERLEAVPVQIAVAAGAPRAATSPAAPVGPPAATAAPPPRAAPPVPASPPARVSPPVRATGRVIQVSGGQLLLDFGANQGIQQGDHIEFWQQQSDPGPFDEAFVRDERIAVGQVVFVNENRSRVVLGMGESVPVGAAAVATERPLTRSRNAPPRVGELWSVGFVVRPFLVLEQLGVGSVNEVQVAYHGHSSVRYQALLSPVAFGTAEAGGVFSALAVFMVSYDTKGFEIGLGFGGQTVNVTDFAFEPGSGLTVSQILRLGALDGLNLEVRSDISLFHSEFEFSAFTGSAQIPVGDRGWLVVKGAGGTVGYGLAEAGGKAALWGNGTAGTLFFRGTAGWGFLFRDDPEEFSFDELFYAGPLVGVGLEWRL